MADNTFKSNISSLMEGLDGFLSTKTVVGEAVKVGSNVILPLADVSFGAGSGVFDNNDKNRSGGGMGGKISPSAVLVINENGAKMIPVKGGDALGKIIDMIPDIAARFVKKDKAGETDSEEFEDED